MGVRGGVFPYVLESEEEAASLKVVFVALVLACERAFLMKCYLSRFSVFLY